jgi:ribosomal protein L16 Arg81 hydroxylase
MAGVGTAIAGPEALSGPVGSLAADMASSLGVGGGAAGFSPQIRQMIEESREEELRERRADQMKRGLTPAQIEAEDRQIAKEQLREAEEMVAMLRDSKPLSGAEFDEFVAIYERYAKLAPDGAQCSPESLRRVLAPAMVIPMTASPIRMMLRSFRELDKERTEARRIFAAMTPEDRADFVRQMSDQIEDWSEADRQAFASLLRANPFDMPLPLRDELLKRLN